MFCKWGLLSVLIGIRRGGGGGGGHIIIPTSWPATEIYHAPRPKTNAYIIYTSLYMNPYRRYSIILYIR